MRYLTEATDMVLRMCPGCDGQRNVWIGVDFNGDVLVCCRTCQRVIQRVTTLAPAGK